MLHVVVAYMYTNGSILRVFPHGCVFICPQVSKLSCFVSTAQQHCNVPLRQNMTGSLYDIHYSVCARQKKDDTWWRVSHVGLKVLREQLKQIWNVCLQTFCNIVWAFLYLQSLYCPCWLLYQELRTWRYAMRVYLC